MGEPLSAVLEEYLATICRIEADKRVARPRDIAGALGVHKSTVTAALRSLADKGLIHYAPYEAATLTDDGRAKAVRVLVRNRVVADFLAGVLGLEREAAERNAASMQRAVDEDVLERVVCFLVFLKQNPGCREQWGERFQAFARQPQNDCGCEEWIRRYLGPECPEKAESGS